MSYEMIEVLRDPSTERYSLLYRSETGDEKRVVVRLVVNSAGSPTLEIESGASIFMEREGPDSRRMFVAIQAIKDAAKHG